MPNISRVTDRLWTGGDMPSHLGDDAMRTELDEIIGAGITHIIDNRLEWNDADFVREHAPEVTYVWNPQDDAGQRMPDSWFERGVGAALGAFAQEGTQVLAHCHMGINRGPSMAFAILLATGENPIRALTAIRESRPVAGIVYSLDALDWWHRVSGAKRSVVKRQRAAVEEWHARFPLDLVRAIRQQVEDLEEAAEG